MHFRNEFGTRKSQLYACPRQQGRQKLAGVAYYTKNRPGNHTLPVKQKAKPKLRPSIHAPITQMPLYFLRKVGFKTEAMKSRCGMDFPMGNSALCASIL